jgi:hypothetical protein
LQRRRRHRRRRHRRRRRRPLLRPPAGRENCLLQRMLPWQRAESCFGHEKPAGLETPVGGSCAPLRRPLL